MYIQTARGNKEKAFVLSEPKESTDLRQADPKEAKNIQRRHVGLARVNDTEYVAFLRRRNGQLDELHSKHAHRVFKKVDIGEAVEHNNMREDLGVPFLPSSLYKSRQTEYAKFKELETSAQKWWEEKVATDNISYYYNYESFKEVQMNSRRIWNDFREDNEEFLRNLDEKAPEEAAADNSKKMRFHDKEEWDSKKMDPKYFQQFSQIIARYEQQRGKIPEPAKLTKRGLKKELKRKRAAEQKEEQEKKKKARAERRKSGSLAKQENKEEAEKETNNHEEKEEEEDEQGHTANKEDTTSKQTEGDTKPARKKRKGNKAANEPQESLPQQHEEEGEEEAAVESKVKETCSASKKKRKRGGK